MRSYSTSLQEKVISLPGCGKRCINGSISPFTHLELQGNMGLIRLPSWFIEELKVSFRFSIFKEWELI